MSSEEKIKNLSAFYYYLSNRNVKFAKFANSGKKIEPNKFYFPDTYIVR